MPTKTRIRAATEADREQAVGVVRTVLREFDLMWDPEGMDAELLTIPQSYTGQGGWFDVVVDEHDVVIGTMGLLPVGGGAIELRKMYLQRDARGGGIGRQLVQKAIADARAAGFDRIELETAAVLESAVRLYRSLGFANVGEATCQRACDYRMVLTLAPPATDALGQVQQQQQQ